MCSVLFFVCVLLLFILCAIRYFCLLSQIWVRENCCFIENTLSSTSNVCANASSINMPFSCHRTETKAFQLVHTHAHAYTISNSNVRYQHFGIHTVASSSFFIVLFAIISEKKHLYFNCWHCFHFIEMSVFCQVSVWHRLNANARIHTSGQKKRRQRERKRGLVDLAPSIFKPHEHHVTL